MAIYHLSAKLISRKAGRSATAAAAYRAGERIVDTRTGEIHDYAKKRGIKHAELILPRTTDWRPTRAELWNAVESKNKRADAQVAREFVVALPDDLSPAQRTRLALDFAHEVADRYGVAADVAIHRPDRQGDQRNHHAHILTSTNRVEGYGFGNKVRELDLVAHNMGGKLGQDNAIDHLRQRWAELANAALEHAGHAERIDHRSHAEIGIEDVPTRHHGPTVTAIERRGGHSRVAEAQRLARQAIQKAAQAAKADLAGQTDPEIAQLEKTLQDAQAERQQHLKKNLERIERARWQTMTVAELEAERHRLARAAQQAGEASRPDENEQRLAKAARQARAELAKAEAHAKAARQAVSDWPERHRLRMKLGADGPLRELRAQAQEAGEAAVRMQQQAALASREHEQARHDRVEAAEMPHRRKAAEVGALLTRKKEQERQARQKAEFEREVVLSLAGVLEDGPSSKGWSALPPKLQDLAGQVHAEIQDERQRSLALERVAAHVVKAAGWEKTAEMVQQAERALRGRERSRGLEL
ncbi:MAG: MobA/MobL family protein [Aquabacterium sp.]|nr:MobA/MobL family protein [Aquabacterium sp.]